MAVQQLKVTGIVTDGKDNPLPGVSVTLKGTGIGTTTNPEGVFILNTPDNSGVLQFSFVGYKTQSVEINGQTKVNIKLQPASSENLSEVVVIGYGTQKRSNVRLQTQTMGS